MTNTNKDTFVEFIGDCFNVVEQEGAPAILATTHVSAGDEREIHAIKVGHPKWGDAEAMADIFWTTALRHAKGLPGYQQFQLNVVFGSNSKATRFLPFGIVGQIQLGTAAGGSAFGGLATEGPHALGQTSQSMRLTEMLVQGSFADRQHVARTQQEIIDGLRVENLASKRENAELWLALREQFAKMVADARAHQMELLKFLRMTATQKKLMELAPALLNMMAGRELFPQSTEDTSIMTSLAEFVDETTLNKLLMALGSKPEATQLVGVITARLATIRQQKSEEQKDEKKLIEQATGRTYEEAERDASGEAVKVLTRIGRGGDALETDSEEAKKLAAANRIVTESSRLNPAPSAVNDNGANGNGYTETSSTADKHPDTALIEDLLGDVSEDEAQMLASILGAKNPDLAERVKARFQALKTA